MKFIFLDFFYFGVYLFLYLGSVTITRIRADPNPYLPLPVFRILIGFVFSGSGSVFGIRIQFLSTTWIRIRFPNTVPDDKDHH